eukprot:COSAG02_NODE_16053_length_1117_cov_1.603143_1_plen_101_part_00
MSNEFLLACEWHCNDYMNLPLDRTKRWRNQRGASPREVLAAQRMHGSDIGRSSRGGIGTDASFVPLSAVLKCALDGGMHAHTAVHYKTTSLMPFNNYSRV